MGTLDLELSTNGGTSWTNIFTKSGDQGNQWTQEIIDLSSYSGQTIDLRFKATIGPAFTSDMAIDLVKMLDNNPSSCTPIVDVDGNPIADGVYSGIIVNSIGTVSSTGNVEFEALTEINLNGGFEIILGGTFEANTGNCTQSNAQQSENRGN